MADQPLSALSETFAYGYSTADVMLILDVLDTSMYTTGTDKGITVATFLAQYLHAGSNITLTPGSNGVTVASTASGAVTSVGLTVPSWYSVAGSPVTSRGRSQSPPRPARYPTSSSPLPAAPAAPSPYGRLPPPTCRVP